jgi:hypothetical protein
VLVTESPDDRVHDQTEDSYGYDCRGRSRCSVAISAGTDSRQRATASERERELLFSDQTSELLRAIGQAVLLRRRGPWKLRLPVSFRVSS